MPCPCSHRKNYDHDIEQYPDSPTDIGEYNDPFDNYDDVRQRLNEPAFRRQKQDIDIPISQAWMADRRNNGWQDYVNPRYFRTTVPPSYAEPYNSYYTSYHDVPPNDNQASFGRSRRSGDAQKRALHSSTLAQGIRGSSTGHVKSHGSAVPPIQVRQGPNANSASRNQPEEPAYGAARGDRAPRKEEVGDDHKEEEEGVGITEKVEEGVDEQRTSYEVSTWQSTIHMLIMQLLKQHDQMDEKIKAMDNFVQNKAKLTDLLDQSIVNLADTVIEDLQTAHSRIDTLKDTNEYHERLFRDVFTNQDRLSVFATQTNSKRAEPASRARMKSTAQAEPSISLSIHPRLVRRGAMAYPGQDASIGPLPRHVKRSPEGSNAAVFYNALEHPDDDFTDAYKKKEKRKGKSKGKGPYRGR
jgi:hypothetical protein